MYGTDDKGDLIGQNSPNLIAPEQRENGLAGIEFALEKGYDRSRDYEVITKDGRRIPVELSAAVMKDAGGKPIGIVIIARDITERKREEEALQKAHDPLGGRRPIPGSHLSE
jgi:PAS domain S-box-containing protein